MNLGTCRGVFWLETDGEGKLNYITKRTKGTRSGPLRVHHKLIVITGS